MLFSLRKFDRALPQVRRCTSLPLTNKPVAYWLFGVGAMVAGMVTVGGITRLTRSGLSMTSWNVQGSLPPMNKEEWEVEFNRYKQFPEWKQRQNMTLDEFKYIYFWEYGHRMMGRAVGVAFILPFTYFAIRKRIPSNLYPKLAVLFGLGTAQGAIGWWMVRSGLDLKNREDLLPSKQANPSVITTLTPALNVVKDSGGQLVEIQKEIRVSPYRLATHLTMAFTTFTLLVWTGLECVNPLNIKEFMKDKSFSKDLITKFIRFRRMAIFNTGLVLTTAISGAFVAGNDAGRAYNTFPKMGDNWFPSKEVLLELTPWYRNLFENTATVQMDHRILALSTLTTLWALYLRTKLSKTTAIDLHYTRLPRLTQLALTAVTHLSAVQVGLGIATLLHYVPLTLGVLHQAGSVALLGFSTVLVHSLKFVKHLK